MDSAGTTTIMADDSNPPDLTNPDPTGLTASPAAAEAVTQATTPTTESIPAQAPEPAPAEAPVSTPATEEPSAPAAHSPVVAAFLAQNPTTDTSAPPATLASTPTPPATQAPGLEELAQRELALAQEHHDKDIAIRNDPRALQNPEVMSKALAMNDEHLRMGQVEIGSMKNALTELRSASADKLLQDIRSNPNDYQKQQELSAQITNSPYFDLATREALHRQQQEILKGTAVGSLRDQGTGYFDVLKRINAPSINPDGTVNTNKITDVSQLLAMTQPDANGNRWLTDAGLATAIKDLNDSKHAETQGDAKVKETQLAVVKHALTFDQGEKLPDPNGDIAMAQFMPVFENYWNSPQRQADQATPGKVTATIQALAEPFKRNPAQYQKDFMEATGQRDLPAVDNQIKEAQVKAIENWFEQKDDEGKAQNPNAPQDMGRFRTTFETYWSSPQRRQDQANGTMPDAVMKIAEQTKYPNLDALVKALDTASITKEQAEKIAIHQGWYVPKSQGTR
jgi:hypothetical protein